jgi:hypothetical protein
MIAAQKDRSLWGAASLAACFNVRVQPTVWAGRLWVAVFGNVQSCAVRLPRSMSVALRQDVAQTCCAKGV